MRRFLSICAFLVTLTSFLGCWTRSGPSTEIITRSCDSEPIEALQCSVCIHCGNAYVYYLDSKRPRCLAVEPSMNCILSQVVFKRSWSIDAHECGFEYVARSTDGKLESVSCSDFFSRLAEYQAKCGNCLEKKIGSVN